MTVLDTLTTSSSLAERARTARRLALAMIFHAGSGHPGGSLSCIDLLTALWADAFEGGEPNGPGRDRFVLSKGHAAPALYAVAVERGLLPLASVPTLRALGSPLQGHPHVRDLEWVGSSTGSLGQGFSVALGKAIGLRQQGREERVWCLLGDGELQEGQVWEAAMAAAHFGADGLCAIVDYNKLQSDARNAEIMGLEPLAERWRSFGWNALEVDGHDLGAVRAALADAWAYTAGPTVVIAHTVKGKGVPYMEDDPPWHGSVTLTPQQLEQALLALDVPAAEIPSWIDGTRFHA